MQGDISGILLAGAGRQGGWEEVARTIAGLFPPTNLRTLARGKKSLRRRHAAAEKLKAILHLDEAERLLFAQSLLATPDERWLRNRRYIQLVNSSKPCAPRKSVS